MSPPAHRNTHAAGKTIDPLIVRVPASTSNIGPGFDTLGMALTLYNDFTIRVLPEGPNRLQGTGTCRELRADGNPFFEIINYLFEQFEETPPPLDVKVQGGVPIGKGLGSSASARVAGALCANHLLEGRLTHQQLLAEVIRAEGHPDNAAPALLGGLTLATPTEDGPLVHVYEPSASWRLVLVIPSYTLSTQKARKLLPKRVDLADAAFNLSRLPFVVDALIEGDGEELAKVLDDRLHEPYREEKIKRSRKLRRAALEAGALTTFVSGSGPTLAAFTKTDASARKVKRAMLATLEDASFTALGLIARPEPRGAQLAELDIH